MGKAKKAKRNNGGRRRGQAQQGSRPPLYQIVVKTLQSEIVRGIYPVGTRLPSEAELVERFGISRQTVRSAIRTLREAGLVRPHQGLGTLVRSPGVNRGYVHHVMTISDLFPVNVETRYDPVDGNLIALPGYAQSLLDEAEHHGTFLHIRGYRFRGNDDIPFNEVDIFVAARFAGVGRVINTHAGSVYAAVEMIYGETISEVHQVIGGFAADREQGAGIGLKPGATGMQVKRIFRIASDNDVALVSFNRYRADDFTFSMTLRRMKD